MSFKNSFYAAGIPKKILYHGRRDSLLSEIEQIRSVKKG
jgi:hypothetical protein